jgi:predicted SprT family Zn-dependent metalloprotease
MKFKEYRMIVDKLINKSFYSLKGKKVAFFEINLGKFSAGVLWLLPNLRIIFVNPRIRKENEKYLKGLFAHELAHFEIANRYGWIKYLCFEILYWLIPSIRRKNEREADKLTVKKGYWKELYYVANKRLYKNKRTARFYLSPEEIKRMKS